MHLFLTGVLPFLAHDHASAVAFLTCRHHNFHASIIPEFLSDEERVKSFCEARQKNEVEVEQIKQWKNLYNLFIQTTLMQFSPSFVLYGSNARSILKLLFKTKYFTRTLQHCSVVFRVHLTDDLLQSLSKVQSLIQLDLGTSVVDNEHLKIIVNSFPSLATLSIHDAELLDPETAISISSPPPPATKTLRSLTMRHVDPLFATQFAPHFSNLRKLVLYQHVEKNTELLRARNSHQTLDLRPLSSSLRLLTDLELQHFLLENVESLKNLVHLSTLEFRRCRLPDSLSFLTQENSLPNLTTLCVAVCHGLSTSSFTSLDNVPNLRGLKVVDSEFDNDCLQYLEKMVHLRTLNLSSNNITGDSRSLKTLMQNLFQLEELSFEWCQHIGNQGAIAGALYSIHSRLRVLNLEHCGLVDDDLNGIGALKNTLEDLDLSSNDDLTSKGLVHCNDLVELKTLTMSYTHGINDLSPLKDCLKLEELTVEYSIGLTDDSFKVFSEEPNSFPNLRLLNLEYCQKCTEEVFEHLRKNNHLVYRLKELNVKGKSKILSSSPTARNHICQLQGLRRLHGVKVFTCGCPSNTELEVMEELVRRLKNLDEIK